MSAIEHPVIHEIFMREAIRLAKEGMDGNHGGPFGAVIVHNGVVVGKGFNRVTEMSDPTAHAEITAIRDAASNLGMPWLEESDLYTSCQPCPMCLAASFWARIRKIFYAGTELDAADIGFDDAIFYKKMGFQFDRVRFDMEQLLQDEAVQVMSEWKAKVNRKHY